MRLTEKQQEIFEELFVRYPVLEKNREDILKAYEVLETCYRTGGKLLVAGNGGSCADAEHIVGELMKGFKKRRPLSEELQRRLAMEDTNHGEELARRLQGSFPGSMRFVLGAGGAARFMVPGRGTALRAAAPQAAACGIQRFQRVVPGLPPGSSAPFLRRRVSR